MAGPYLASHLALDKTDAGPRVMADEVVSHAFSHGFHPEHSRRLAAYWAEALGGPPVYSGS